MDILELQKKVIEFRDSQGWEQYHSVKDPAMAGNVLGVLPAFQRRKTAGEEGRMQGVILKKLEINAKNNLVEKAKAARKSKRNTESSCCG
jgi:hypothetical protein